MEKDFLIVELFDIYGELLTEKQRKVFTSYYMLDLSLAEIAEPEGTTRQSVHEIIKSTIEKLYHFERVLKVKEKNDKLIDITKNLEDQKIAKQILELIGR